LISPPSQRGGPPTYPNVLSPNHGLFVTAAVYGSHMDQMAAQAIISRSLAGEPRDLELAFVAAWRYCETNRAQLHRSVPGGLNVDLPIKFELVIDLATPGFAFQLLRSLDQALKDNALTGRAIEVAGDLWLIVRRSSYHSLSAGTTSDASGLTALSALSKHHFVVPKSLSGVELIRRRLNSKVPSVRPKEGWNTTTDQEVGSLRAATFKERTISETRCAATPTFRIGIAPIRSWPYASTEGITNPIVLAELDTDCIDGLVMELRETIEWAANSEVSVLVLPELILPAEMAHTFQETILSIAPRHLALCVVGLSHRASTQSQHKYVNEAIVLGPLGGLIWSHQKLDPYNKGDTAESLEPGTEITLVETPLGHFIVGICKDLIGSYQDRYLQSR
jgi:Carbon-nitrogen hydrolase